MNETETRAEYIDPKLMMAGWGVDDDTKVLREFKIAEGPIGRGIKYPEIADYILVYKNLKLAVIEAKSIDFDVSEGVAQAKSYADKLGINYTYSTNGKEIYEISMENGAERLIDKFPTPEELWKRTFSDFNEWKDKFNTIPFEIGGSGKKPRYYQELAVNKALDAVAEDKNRILLTLATGTGKTFISFQIAWKLFQTRWNLARDGVRRPRILFLADRNILADQAINAFGSFEEKAIVRIDPIDIRKKGGVPKSGNIFFTIFQTFMSGPEGSPYFGDYEPDFFDFIVVDECHRGGANDEGNWRAILEYFSSAVQLGLTATPKRKDNVDTYRYFGEPVYTYSLKQGVNDGFLTPFRVKRIKTTLDEYIYSSDDEIIEGEIEEGKVYEENDFNNIIVIKEREAKRVQILLNEINQNEKTIVFCANQAHAGLVRDLINQFSKSKNPYYCVRVTANDGFRGEQFLREFQDNERSIPTILTTSQKLSTGVDARNIRNIVLLRPIKSMVEFKQIIGRGTRLFDGKEYFTIYDFVDAYKLFLDPEWDGEPVDQTTETIFTDIDNSTDVIRDGDVLEPKEPTEPRQKLRIKLRDGKEREIKHMVSLSFWSADGRPVSVQDFMDSIFNDSKELFSTEEELIKLWSNPETREKFLESLANNGYGNSELESLQKMIDAEDADLLDVLAYISFLKPPVSRSERVQRSKSLMLEGLGPQQRDFVEFLLTKYQQNGVMELETKKLVVLLNLKYKAIANAEQSLGSVEEIRKLYINSQEKLYTQQ
jgi:type I restriction enzyme R subunit